MQTIKSNDKEENSLNNSSANNSNTGHAFRSEYLADALILFVNIYLENLKQVNPELEIETKDKAEFWEELSKESQLKGQNLILWPCENKDVDLDEKDEDDYSDGLVFRIDTDAWRLKSPDEIEQTHDEDMVCKYDVYNDFEINFRKAEDNFDPEELSIYRISVTPLTEGSVIKQIDMIKNQGEEITMKEMRFEDLNEIVFIKSDISIFDNSQVDSNQIFLISSPYTIFLWIGQKVDSNILKGSLSIFRSFYYTIRKTPMIFFPSYMEEEQNLGIPNLQIIYKNSEDSRFQSLFKQWREIRFGYIMLHTNSDYKSRGRKAINKPRYLTITGKLTKLEDAFALEEDEKVVDEEDKDENLTHEDLKIFRNSATKKHKDK